MILVRSRWIEKISVWRSWVLFLCRPFDSTAGWPSQHCDKVRQHDLFHLMLMFCKFLFPDRYAASSCKFPRHVRYHRWDRGADDRLRSRRSCLNDCSLFMGQSLGFGCIDIVRTLITSRSMAASSSSSCTRKFGMDLSIDAVEGNCRAPAGSRQLCRVWHMNWNT